MPHPEKLKRNNTEKDSFARTSRLVLQIRINGVETRYKVTTLETSGHRACCRTLTKLLVSGKSTKTVYTILESFDGSCSCSCLDHLSRGRECKHILTLRSHQLLGPARPR